MSVIEGSIISPKGYKAIGGHVGLKKNKKDLSIVISDVPAVFAGMFTKNKVKAAPVLWDMEIAKNKNKVKGFIVNSGNANACTGNQGIEDNYKIAETLSNCVGCKTEEILVCSTGVIGVPLPMDIMENGINTLFTMLDYGNNCGELAAEGIMTTDTFSKTIAVEVQLSHKKITIGGMAKGSGMIHPNMATMLSFITTDINISQEILQKVLNESVADSYNMISVDGDTSTNDTILILANGMAENELITEENEDYLKFKYALDYVNKKLATDIVRDGEGATKLMEVKIIGAKTKEDARAIGKSVVSSSLFKAALFGADANWGRVLCAMGYSDGEFNVSDVTIKFKSVNDNRVSEEIILMEHSVPLKFNEDIAKEILERKNIFIDIILNDGTETATAWGCDLTYDYVKINGDYRS